MTLQVSESKYFILLSYRIFAPQELFTKPWYKDMNGGWRGSLLTWPDLFRVYPQTCDGKEVLVWFFSPNLYGFQHPVHDPTQRARAAQGPRQRTSIRNEQFAGQSQGRNGMLTHQSRQAPCEWMKSRQEWAQPWILHRSANSSAERRLLYRMTPYIFSNLHTP